MSIKNLSGAKTQRSISRFVNRIPWLWVDLVVSHCKLPAWVLSAILFFVLLSAGSLISLLAGEPVQFLMDIRRIIIFSLPAFASYTITSAHNNLKRLEASLAPWVASSAEDTAIFWEKAPLRLMHGYWIFALLWVVIIPCLYIVMQNTLGQMPPPDAAAGTGLIAGEDMGHPKTIANIAMIFAPLVAYFMGSATAVSAVGLGKVAHCLSQELDLKEEFVLQGAKSVLKPFIRMFWVTWSTIALPLLMIGMLAVTNGKISTTTLITDQIPFSPVDIVPLALVVLMLALAVLVPQIYINRLLRKEKREAMDNVLNRIKEATTISATAPTEEVLRHMYNFQSLVYLEKKIDKFKPTMVDTSFVLQNIAVISTVLSAFLAVRTFLNLFIST